jgi:hypothetical protein
VTSCNLLGSVAVNAPMNMASPTSQPSPQLQARIARLLGAAPHYYWRLLGGGYTPAARWIGETDHSRYFIKVATTPLTAKFLHREIQTYACIQAAFMPQFIAADADETEPILILEDLSEHFWPPPWTESHIHMVVDTIHQMHTTTAALEPYAALYGDGELGWTEVARDPRPFLSLGLASASWLDQVLPVFIAWESQCQTEGTALTHMDLRSDNMCLRGSRAVLIDWNLACLSNPKLDLGFWLPSLAFEGGPAPDTLLPHAPEVAAWVCGFFASRAGLPNIPDAPRVRLVQRQQLETALPWAVRALDLPPPLAHQKTL